MKKLKEFKTILKEASKYKIKIIICSILVLLSSLSYILVGYLNGAAIESVTQLNLKLAITYLVIYLIIEILFDIIDIIARAGLHKIEIRLSRRIGFLTYQKALNLPSVAYEEKKSGELINRISNDTETIINSFGSLLKIFSSLISTFVILIYIFFNSYLIALEIIIFIAIYSLIVKHYNPLLKKANEERKKVNDEYTSLISESVRGIREIKTLGIKKSLFQNLKKLIEEMITKSDQELSIDKKYDLISCTLKSLLEVGTFITCAWLLYYGNISLTFFVAITYYIYRFTWLIENITSFNKIYNQVLVAVARINEILENKLYQDVSFGNAPLTNCKGEIEFKDITFNYPNEDIILNHFNVKFPTNKKIAVVGKSGQGKSTLFNLITRIFDPNTGNITIDNIDIKNITEESLRKNISIIRQEPFLFNKSIKENFLLINNNLSIDNIRKFCKMAYIDDYIMSLPNKYDTVLGEGGVNLSGGQKQRLSIARALAKESKIILFDEATSALDNESQNYIKKVIDKLVEDHTVIIIAHRLSTIVDADIIYIVDKGQVVDKGTHKELLKKSTIYKKLYENEE